MAQTKERRVTFSSEDPQNAPETSPKNHIKQDSVSSTPPSPILKSKTIKNNGIKSDEDFNKLIDFDEELDMNQPSAILSTKIILNERTDKFSSEEPSTNNLSYLNSKGDTSKQCNKSDENVELECEDHNTAEMLRERSRQLMRQYILHRNRSSSSAHSGSDSDSLEQSVHPDHKNLSNVEIAYGLIHRESDTKELISNGGNDSIHKPQRLKKQLMANDDDLIFVDKSNLNTDQPQVKMPSADKIVTELSNDEESSWTSHSHSDSLPSSRVRSSSTRFFIPEMDAVDRFAVFDISSSKQDWGQTFLGLNWLDELTQYKSVVLNSNDEVLFVGITADQASLRKGFFDMTIMDRTGNELIHFRRLFAIKTKSMFEIGLKKKCRLEVTSPSGFIIGNVEKCYNNGIYYILEDRSGDCLLLIKRRCVTIDCPLLWDYEFQVLLPDYKTQVGKISWSCLNAEHEEFYGTEISFPVDLSHECKSLLLGACFLLNSSRRHGAFLYDQRESLWWKMKNKKARERWNKGKESELF